MPEETFMGFLVEIPPPKGEEGAFEAVVASLDHNFPKDWREWPITNYSFEELFEGDTISPAIDAKIRFAIPTEDLAKAFSPESTSLSERRYRSIRSSILKWPLGRAILYAPHYLMQKIHSHPNAYVKFMDTVHAMKPRLTKRSETSKNLEGCVSHSPASSSKNRRGRSKESRS